MVEIALLDAHSIGVGKTGAGKTHFYAQLAQDTMRHVVFIDSKGDTRLPGFRLVDQPVSFDARLLRDKVKLRVRPPRSKKARDAYMADLSETLLAVGKRMGGRGWCAVIADEAWKDARASDDAGPLVALALEGRSMGVTLHALVQQPQSLSNAVFGQRGHLVLFKLEGDWPGGSWGKLGGLKGVSVPANVARWLGARPDQKRKPAEWDACPVGAPHSFALYDGDSWRLFPPLGKQ